VSGARVGWEAPRSGSATARAVALMGMTLGWVNLGMAKTPACRPPAAPTSLSG
jgi:hypothetical protein